MTRARDTGRPMGLFGLWAVLLLSGAWFAEAGPVASSEPAWPQDPLVNGQPADLNAVDASALMALPGIGEARATAILSERERRPFADPSELTRVRGIGPATVASLAPLIAANGGPGPQHALGPTDLNRATAADLDALPGIGPVLAERIVASRSDHGPFTGVGDLQRVRGIGPATVARLRPLVEVR